MTTIKVRVSAINGQAANNKQRRRHGVDWGGYDHPHFGKRLFLRLTHIRRVCNTGKWLHPNA